MSEISVTAPRTHVEASVEVSNRPAISVDVSLPERPELAFSVDVERQAVTLNVISNSDADAPFDLNLALLYQTAKVG